MRFDRRVVRSLSVEITFVGICSSRGSHAEGLIRLPDGTLRAFSGWLDLLGALEHATAEAPTTERNLQ
jgi:hypothetical protein